jgi:hypothetical protein
VHPLAPPVPGVWNVKEGSVVQASGSFQPPLTTAGDAVAAAEERVAMSTVTPSPALSSDFQVLLSLGNLLHPNCVSANF